MCFSKLTTVYLAALECSYASQEHKSNFQKKLVIFFKHLGFCMVWNFFLKFCFVFRDRVSLCSPGCPEIHFVDQAGLKFRDPPASVSRVLELKACGPTAQREPLSNVYH